MRSWLPLLVLLAGCRCGAEPVPPAPEPEAAPAYERTDLRAPDSAACMKCAFAVRNALRSRQGVGQIEVILSTGTYQVQHDPAVVSVDQLIEAANESGYETGLASEVPAPELPPGATAGPDGPVVPGSADTDTDTAAADTDG